MRILDRYIIKEFFYTLFMVLFICALILTVAMLFDRFENILEKSPSWYYVVGYFLNQLPFKLIQSLPLVVAIALMFSVGMLAKHNETTAMFGAGVSGIRIAAPLLIAAVFISIVVFYLSEHFVPECESRARYIKEKYIKGKAESFISKNRDIFLKGKGKRFYVMKEFDNKTNMMTLPSIIDLNEDLSSIRQRIDATSAQLVILGEEGAKYWRFENAVRYQYSSEGFLIGMEMFEEPIDILMEENLEQFLSTRKEPEEMNFSELKHYISLLAARGEQSNAYMTALLLKISFPLAPVIMVLVGFNLAANVNPRNRIVRFSMGILLAIIYFLLTAFCMELGYNNNLPAMVAAWLPTMLFSLLGVWMFWKTQKIDQDTVH